MQQFDDCCDDSAELSEYLHSPYTPGIWVKNLEVASIHNCCGGWLGMSETGDQRKPLFVYLSAKSEYDTLKDCNAHCTSLGPRHVVTMQKYMK